MLTSKPWSASNLLALFLEMEDANGHQSFDKRQHLNWEK